MTTHLLFLMLLSSALLSAEALWFVDSVAAAISADTSKIEVFPIGVKTSSLTKTDSKALNAAPFATLSDGYLTSISPKG